jgi:putative two-component system response regulator
VSNAEQDPVERVLVVDDQEPVARTVARWLGREGLECDLALSVRDALDLLDARSYGLVFADVHLPGESGLDLAREVKARDDSAQVIIITGSTTLDTAIEALRLGADDYLVKPFEPQALLHAAGRAREHRRLLLENRDYRRTLELRVREQARGLERLYLSSVRALVQALEAKDVHTRGHSERVADYAESLLDQIEASLDPESLRVGAQLHDIGKIGIGSTILGKDGPLDGDEVRTIQRHPTIGVEILSPLLEDRVALDVVRHHHERWDGEGYPDGLSGADIPLAARIVAVADTFDAMTTARPYRDAKTPAQAVVEIQAEAGRQFDPEIARVAGTALLPIAGLVS